MDTVTLFDSAEVSVAIVLAVSSLLIRPATAFLTSKAKDNGLVGAAAGIGLAGVTAGAAALADVGNIADDWKNVVLTAALAWTGAAAANISLYSGKAVAWIHDKTDGWLKKLLGQPAV